MDLEKEVKELQTTVQRIERRLASLEECYRVDTFLMPYKHTPLTQAYDADYDRE